MEISFEEALKELDEVVEKLSAGNTSLDEMVRLYERGTALTKHCQTILDAYEKRFETMESGEEQ